MSRSPTILTIGIDTLKVNVKQLDAAGQPLKEPSLPDLLASMLFQWQEQAKAANTPLPTTIPFHEARLLIYPNGAPSWKYILRNDCLELKIMPRLKLPIIAKVTFESMYLWKMGRVQDALEEVRGLLVDLFGPDLLLQAAQLDLCVDLVNWKPPQAWKEMIISHAMKKRSIEEARKDQEYYHGHALQTILVSGHGAPVSLKVYNKTAEIEQRSKTKTWFYDLWQGKRDEHGHPLWDYERWKAVRAQKQLRSEDLLDVWRVEYSIEREGLNQMNLESIEEVLAHLKRIWRYCTCDWLRFAQPGLTRNRTRWKTQAAWKLIQQAFDQEGDRALDSLGPLTRQRKRQVNIDQGIAAIAGYLTTLGAWSEDLYEEGAYTADLFASVYYKVLERWEKQGIAPEEVIRFKKFLYSQKP